MALALYTGVCVLWVYSVWRLGALYEWHHFWIGVALWAHPTLWWCGLGIMADDAIQHAVQLWRPAFRSPLHLLYRHTLYRAWEWHTNRHTGGTQEVS